MTRVRQSFGVDQWGNPIVEVRGPQSRESVTWYLEMMPLGGMLRFDWRGKPERARAELAALREALDFIEAQLGLGAAG